MPCGAGGRRRWDTWILLDVGLKKTEMVVKHQATTKTLPTSNSCKWFIYRDSPNKQVPSLKLIAKAPENGWLEYDRFLLGYTLFSGANCYCSFGEGTT